MEWRVPAGLEPATARLDNPHSFGPVIPGELTARKLLELYQLSYDTLH